MNRTVFTVFAALVSLTLATHVAADDSRWAVRGYGGYISSVSDEDVDTFSFDGFTSQPVDAVADWQGELGSSSAFGLGVEYRVTPHRLGVELSGMFANLEGDLTGVASVAGLPSVPLSEKVLIDYTPIYLGPNIHLLKKDWPVDLYVGAFGAWTRLANGTLTVFDVPVDFQTESSFGWGLSAGLDARLGKTPWMISAGVRALTSDSSFAVDLSRNGDDPLVGPIEFDLYPVTVLAGIGYRF